MKVEDIYTLPFGLLVNNHETKNNNKKLQCYKYNTEVDLVNFIFNHKTKLNNKNKNKTLSKNSKKNKSKKNKSKKN